MRKLEFYFAYSIKYIHSGKYLEFNAFGIPQSNRVHILILKVKAWCYIIFLVKELDATYRVVNTEGK